MNIYLKPTFMQEQIRAIYMTPSLRLQEEIELASVAAEEEESKGGEGA